MQGQAELGGSATKDTTSKQPGPYFTEDQWDTIEQIAIEKLDELGQFDLCEQVLKIGTGKVARGELL